MTFKIRTSGKNSLVFKPHFHLLKDYETLSDLTPTMANIELGKISQNLQGVESLYLYIYKV
jgi:hypothetical protein